MSLVDIGYLLTYFCGSRDFYAAKNTSNFLKPSFYNTNIQYNIPQTKHQWLFSVSELAENYVQTKELFEEVKDQDDEKKNTGFILNYH